MSSSINRVTLVGRVGVQPEARTSKGGRLYTRLNIATNSPKLKLEDGTEKPSQTEWHYVVAWGGLAENCITYLQKGSLVYIEGYLSSFANDKAPEGPRYTTITARDVQFLARPLRENQAESA